MLVDINLLSEKERDRPAFVVAAILLILIGLVTGLVFYLLGNSYASKQQVIAAQSTEVLSQQASIKEQMLTTVALNDTQKLQKTVDWVEAYQYDTLPLIRQLTALLPERGFFMNFSFTSPNVAEINVQFDTSREAAFYLMQLKASEMITEVKLTSLTYQPMEEPEAESEEEASAGTTTTIEQAEPVMPRYLASYSLTFLDTRMPAEGTAVPTDPNAPPVEGQTPPEGEAPAEEQPAEPPVTESQPPAEDAQGDEANE
ncbi:hypothetical protein [Paenisporosarcina sp.]|uniref:hypothetical protein n=1 Tax=Paenisporosarcina sp. TaxID=1932001 RepID=UPI003C7901BE